MVNKIKQSNTPDTQLPEPIIPNNKFNKLFKKFHFLLPLTAFFVIFVLVIFILTTLSFSLNNKSTTIIDQPNISTPTKTPASENIDDWDTYYNNIYGFYLKYPQNWEIETDSVGHIRFKNNENDYHQDFDINIYGMLNHKNLSIRNFYKEMYEGIDKDTDVMYRSNPFEIVGNAKPITIDGYSGFRYDSEPDPYLGDQVAILLKGKIMLFTRSIFQENARDELNKKRFDQILSTIKFFPDMSTWKIYNNTEQGISLKYPQDMVIEKNNSQLLISNKEYDITFQTEPLSEMQDWIAKIQEKQKKNDQSVSIERANNLIFYKESRQSSGSLFERNIFIPMGEKVHWLSVYSNDTNPEFSYQKVEDLADHIIIPLRTKNQIKYNNDVDAIFQKVTLDEKGETSSYVKGIENNYAYVIVNYVNNGGHFCIYKKQDNNWSKQACGQESPTDEEIKVMGIPKEWFK